MFALIAGKVLLANSGVTKLLKEKSSRKKMASSIVKREPEKQSDRDWETYQSTKL